MRQMPLNELRNRLGEVVDQVVATDEPIQITREGKPVAVLMSAADYEELARGLASLSSAEAALFATGR